MQFYDKKFTLHKAYPKSAYPPHIFTPRAKCKLNLYNLKSMMSLITSFFPLIVLTLFQIASYQIFLFFYLRSQLYSFYWSIGFYVLLVNYVNSIFI